MKKPILLSWSSGKDSAWALHILRQRDDIEVEGLFCTVNQEFERIAMHAVRVELVRRQAESVDLPIRIVPIPYPCDNAEYQAVMGTFVEESRRDRIEAMAFGDLYLEDVRRYREDNLAGTGIRPLFPLWGTPPEALSRDMIDSGLRATITCLDPEKIPSELIGLEYDRNFLEKLPDGVDPCGENGEFHSFAFDGPMFVKPVDFTIGDEVRRDGFVFADLVPA
ncbi:MAG: adenine nucleotide alpha hydrolase [Proteobacteria bacterium]|nr:adenine nucleotide alpha hydrolase [Pseudomonadota bacterium]